MGSLKGFKSCHPDQGKPYLTGLLGSGAGFVARTWHASDAGCGTRFADDAAEEIVDTIRRVLL
jgi:hypothetical protein